MSDNLKHPLPPEEHRWKPGQSGNPAGKPKGSRHLSTIVQNLLDDPTFAEKFLAEKPGWWDTLPNKNLAEGITTAMIIKAMAGDSKASEWVRKTGWGDKITHDFEPGLFTKAKMEIEIVDDTEVKQETEEGS